MEEICLIEVCEKLVENKKHGLCRGHYDRYRHKGEVGESALKKFRKLPSYREIHAKKIAEKEGREIKTN